MATVALRLGMLSRQRVFGVLVVIESCGLPATLVMAGLAFVTQPAFMPLLVIVIAMTAHAFQGKLLLKQDAFVARHALRLIVLSFETKAGFFVIKGRRIPRFRGVTVATLLAEAAFMSILVVSLAVA